MDSPIIHLYKATAEDAQKGNSGARRAAARRAAAAGGSTEMPALEPGVYPFVKDAFLIGPLEVSDIWVMDMANERVLHFVSVGTGFNVGLRGAREFGAMYLPSTDAIPGFSLSFDLDGTLVFGGSGSLIGNPVSMSPTLAPSVSGGPSFGLAVGAGPFGSYTKFQKVYTFGEAPSHLPLGR